MSGETIPRGVAGKLARSAGASENAVVVGNRAGVVEWANEAWTRVTGYALDASVGKPVLEFLEEVEVEPELVDFVAGCFRRGKTCEVEIPLTTPDGRALWLQLRVEPLRDAAGEPSDFIAVASDISQRKALERALAPGLEERDLGSLVAGLAPGLRGALGPRCSFDFALASELPLVLADARLLGDLLERLVHRAAEDVGEGWGTITFSTGVLGADRGPIGCAHLATGAPAGPLQVYLEVHDTGSSSHSAVPNIVGEPFVSERFPRHAVSRHAAELVLQSMGARLELESEPWTGTSALLLFPCAALLP